MTTTPESIDFELFDKHAKFVMPTPEQLGLLDKNSRERFEAVRLAALDAETAATAIKQAQATVKNRVEDVRTCEDRLRTLRPPMDAVTAARMFINSTR